MNLINAIMLGTITTFLNYSISEDIDKVGKVETSGSTITSTDSRYLKSL